MITLLNITLLLASKGPAIGGLEKQVALQAHALAESGAEVSVIASSFYKPLFDPSVRFISEPFKQSRRNPFLKARLKRLIKEGKPDITHAHGHKAAQLLTSIKSKLPCPIVCTAHGTKQKNNPASLSFAKADLAIAVSEGVAKSLPLGAHIIPNGIKVNTSSTSRADIIHQFGLNPGLPIIAAVGRLDLVKRYDRLIKIADSLSANIIIVGEGPMKTELMEQAKQTKITPVYFAGFQENATDFIESADILCISSDREGMSLVMMEALMLSTPVIATQVSGVEWLPNQCVVKTENGLHADEKVSAELRDKLSEYLLNLDEIKRIYAPYFKDAQQKLKPSQIASQLISEYHKLNRSSSSAPQKDHR